VNIRYHEGVPVDFKTPRGEPCLFILDDLLNDAYSSVLVFDLFTIGSNHRNISVILITRNILLQSMHCSDISLNPIYLVIIKNVRDRSQFSRFVQQMYPKNSADLYDSYLHATVKLHGYLVLDLSQDTNDLPSFRTEIFPDESPFPLIYEPVVYEMVTIDLSQRIHFLKVADPKLRKAIIANCNQETMKSICQCVLNVLRGNIPLSDCS